MPHSLRGLFFSICLLGVFSVSTPTAALTDAEIEELFNQGLQESELGDLKKAIDAFEAILSAQPGLGRVQVELALANFRALNFAAARRYAEQILQSPDTPESVKVTIRRLLEEIDEQSKPSVWTPYISLGLMYDDNVNVGPGAGIIDIGGNAFLLDPSAAPLEDFALQINAGIGHRYLSPTTVKIGGIDTAFLWRSQLRFFRNQYFEEDDFHLNVITASTGPVWHAPRKWSFALTGQADDIRIGDESIAWYAGIAPRLTFFFGGNTALSASFKAQRREFTRSEDTDRDSNYFSGGLSLGHEFKIGNISTSVLVGGRLFTENADSSRRSNDGDALNLSLNIKPFKNSNLYASYARTAYKYDGVEPVFGIARDEVDQRYTIGADYTFKNTDNYLGDWVLGVNYNHTDHDSNVDIFEYTRDRVLATLSRTF